MKRDTDDVFHVQTPWNITCLLSVLWIMCLCWEMPCQVGAVLDFCLCMLSTVIVCARGEEHCWEQAT